MSNDFWIGFLVGILIGAIILWALKRREEANPPVPIFVERATNVRNGWKAETAGGLWLGRTGGLAVKR